MKSSVLGLVFGFALVAAPGQVMAQTPASPAPPAAQPQPPRPFPEGSKFAYIDIQRIAAESAEGKASTAKVQALNQKKVAELAEMNKKLQADQQRLQTQGAMLNDAARADLERSIERQTKEFQRSQQDAQEEVQQLQNDLQNAFQTKLYPVIQAVASEKGIQVLFSQRDSGIVFADPGLDITPEVIKRFDSAATPAPAAAQPATPAPTAPAPTAPAPKPKN
jgi:outer membrane protein